MAAQAVLAATLPSTQRALRVTPETTEQRVALALREHWATPVVQVVPALLVQMVIPEPLALLGLVLRPVPLETPGVRPRQPMPMRPL